MKLFFDPKTYKLIDITAPTPVELNYHYSYILDDQEYPECYDKNGERFYQISPSQLDVGKVPNDIFFTETLKNIFSEITCKEDFFSGYSQGQTDGYVYKERHYMEKMRHVSWSFLIGYEYGVLIGCYLRDKKMAD